ncbi:hypothetical protein PD280_06305 [Virgibacillus salarius]|uniref:hypothetical protein n=1 Tax=Virgibacillus salarius TaxID=447199 RepID=UPI00248FBF16|nr:hypothetical protein [Virgibacillus salarius]WBX81330.1 hypothetical protein PD280_06305 [Virgibacillus salarius]
MKEISLTVTKLENMASNLPNMTEEEKTESLNYLFYVQNNQFKRLTEQFNRILKVSEQQNEYITYLENKKQVFENFISDNQLQKRFELYTRSKEAI